MATHALDACRSTLQLEPLASFPNLRVLAWDRETLYASSGYRLFSAHAVNAPIAWHIVGSFSPAAWRHLTCQFRLSSRLARDGLHALAIDRAGHLIAAVPGAIITLRNGDSDFRVSHRILRGTRPLHITATPEGLAFWGEYFDNRDRDEVHIYASADAGLTWDVAYTFAKHSIRHIHNLVYDPWERCLWIFTGDYGRECRVLRASTDFRSVDAVIAGNQQARAVAAVVTEAGLFFASDTPLERNFIYKMDRRGRIDKLHALPSSSIYACQNRDGIFFSTMVEPSHVNRTREVALFGSSDGLQWNAFASWHKDRYPMKFFQYGNAFLPDGKNTTALLAVTTIATENSDLQTTIWRTAWQ
ncbi:MAG TPA: hypothetical protein VF133_05580 [Terriglobales bacterium]